MMRAWLGVALGLANAMGVACTDTPLRPVSQDFDNRVALRGNFCTTTPRRAEHPVRVLFAVDSSDSMVFNDPGNLTATAIEGVVRRFRDEPNVNFGILRWGESVVRELVDYNPGTPVLFTKDETLLGEAFARMRQLPTVNLQRYLGGTNYDLALRSIRDYIIQDLAQNPGLTSTVQYYVEFMTDGMPQTGDSDPNATRDTILAQVADLHLTFAVRVDVISIVEIATVTAEFLQLLPEMADAGGGSFVQLCTPDGLDAELARILSDDLMLVEFDLATLADTDEPRSLLVQNRNARVDSVDGVLDIWADSDGDGLIDVRERELGSDPSSPDTDGDGLDDSFEAQHLGEFDPNARQSPPLTAEQLFDKDDDGLIAFVENRLGTDPDDPDTDGDGVADGLEVRLGVNPLVSDMRADADDDGVANGFELRQGTNPGIDEGEERVRWSYDVEPVGDPTQVYNGRRCYALRFGNITLVETEAAVDEQGNSSPAGLNRLELWRIEHSIDAVRPGAGRPLELESVRGDTWTIFRPAERYRDPPAMELVLRRDRLDG